MAGLQRFTHEFANRKKHSLRKKKRESPRDLSAGKRLVDLVSRLGASLGYFAKKPGLARLALNT